MIAFYLYFSFSFSPSTYSPTIIVALPPLPYQWAELTSTSCLAGNVTRCGLCEKQLHWKRFLHWHWKHCQASFLCYFDCIERLHYSPPLQNPQLLQAWRGLEFQGLFLLWFLREQTNAGQGQHCTHPGKSWYRGECSLGQPLRITPPCLMYMKQNSSSSC